MRQETSDRRQETGDRRHETKRTQLTCQLVKISANKQTGITRDDNTEQHRTHRTQQRAKTPKGVNQLANC